MFFAFERLNLPLFAFIFSVRKLRIKSANIKNSKRGNSKRTETMFLLQFSATESEAKFGSMGAWEGHASGMDVVFKQYC